MRAPFLERCHLPILVVAGAQGWGRWGGGVVGKKVTLRFGGWMDKVRYTCPDFLIFKVHIMGLGLGLMSKLFRHYLSMFLRREYGELDPRL